MCVSHSFTHSHSYFQQNNEPCHKAQIISDWFLEHDNEFTLLKWPPQSPDRNPIEHFGMWWNRRFASFFAWDCMSLLPFWALNMVVVLLSMQGQKALGFHQKYLNLCSDDEWRCYRFGTTWGQLKLQSVSFSSLSPSLFKNLELQLLAMGCTLARLQHGLI